MKKTKSRYTSARYALIFWTLFIGVGAVAGATGMMSAPDGSALGMQGMLPYFQVLPFASVLFRDFLFPGIALLVVNGVTNLVAAGFLFAKKKAGIYLGGIFGVTLMLWIIIQFVIFPANFMSTIYFFFGLFHAITGYIALVFYKQEQFVFSESDYKNVGKDGKTLVVYFSRMGYVKKLAYERADALGADIYEVKSTENTKGTAGFWWCGRYGMHRWEMPIEEISLSLEKYERVVICSPIWVFNLCAPMRAFCKKAAGRIKAADYILVHHQNNEYLNAADEMDALLGIRRDSVKSYRCRQGKYSFKTSK